jgi:uridine kinase
VGARVIVVAGPSGSGKSRLCARLSAEHGWPVVRLDDFYKDGDDPTLPWVGMSGGRPVVDWDHPDSWLPEEAFAALVQLCQDGRAAMPVYDIASDGRIGHRVVTLGASPYVLAEGVFADQLAGPCRDAGLLADAVCVHNPALLTFWRRLVRDLSERRKPVWVLVRRGISLLRHDRDVVERAERAGCTVLTSEQAFQRITSGVTADDDRGGLDT